MQYDDKQLQDMGKEELVGLVKRLQREPAGSGSSAKQAPQAGAERAPRDELDTEIEFIFDLDVVRARGINISETGIAFVVDKAPPVEMRFVYQGDQHHYSARLVRTERLAEGGFLFGLQFAGEVKPPDLPDPPDEDSPIVEL